MAWTEEGPAAKFKGGDAVFYGIGERRNVITVVEVGEYHDGYRDRYYLGRFPDNAVRPVWESEIALVIATKGGTDRAKAAWQTQSLWRQYEKVIAKSYPVRQWLEGETTKLNGDLLKATASQCCWPTIASSWWPAGTAVFVVGVIVSLITLGNSSGGFPWLGWLFVVLGVGGLVSWVVLGVAASGVTEALREAKRKERTSDPLWQRVELILKAVKEFTLHRDHFRAWQSAVDEGLQDGDQELSDRYHTFLTHAALGIDASIKNFTRTAELTARQMKYRTDHPELAEAAASTHLADLMALLNYPVELPAPISLMDPREALEHEEALGEAVSQLYEGELARQIDEMLQKKPVPSES